MKEQLIETLKNSPKRLLLASLLATSIGAVTQEKTEASVLEQQCPPYMNAGYPGAYEYNLVVYGCWINEIGDINAANQAAYQNLLNDYYYRQPVVAQQPQVIVVQEQQRPRWNRHHRDGHRDRDRGHHRWQR